MRLSIVVSGLALGLAVACGEDANDSSGSSGGSSGSSGQATSSSSSGGSSGSSSGALDGGEPRCTTHFRYVPPSGQLATIVRVTGEWNAFSSDGPVLAAQSDGSFAGDVELPIGRVGYKFLVNGQYVIDPAARVRKYVDGVENSAVDVVGCALPSIEAGALRRTRVSEGQGTLHAEARLRAGTSAPIDPTSVRVTLRKDFTDLPAPDVHLEGALVRVDAVDLMDGKYTLLLDVQDRAGNAAKTVRMPFWIEADTFEWRDAVIYMGMNDRLGNGDPSNDVAPIAGVDVRAQFQGGDLQGVRERIASGYLDGLGVRAIWLSPFHQNPDGAYPGNGGHQVTGYHGYWPTRAREVDARLGGAQALRDLVREAHAHGIRVLQDFVLNHVHEDHEYRSEHPDWFRTSCVCGTDGCGWTERRLDCLFTPYLPDVNWSVTELSQQMEADAIHWVREFDLDGLRVDAVKHVEDLAVINLAGALRSEFESPGNDFRLFLTGETAMGWSECHTSPGCIGNEENYGTISRYIGPRALDGQFDFVLYHAAPLTVFATESRSLYHADFWTNASQLTYPAGSVMTPYIGSHDTPRFVSFASYPDGDVPNRQWDDVAQAPSSSAPYTRAKLALAWLFSLPGAPLLYYGDEYGEWGGADPNNRHFFRAEGALDGEERGVLSWTRKLGQARKQLTALRRGRFLLTPYQNDNLSITVRRMDDGQTVVVMLSRTAQTANVMLPLGAELPNGTVLRDYLGDRTVTVQGNAFSVEIPDHGALYLAP